MSYLALLNCITGKNMIQLRCKSEEYIMNIRDEISGMKESAPVLASSSVAKRNDALARIAACFMD